MDNIPEELTVNTLQVQQYNISPVVKDILSKNSVQEVRNIYKKNSENFPVWLDSTNHARKLIDNTNEAISKLDELKSLLSTYKNNPFSTNAPSDIIPKDSHSSKLLQKINHNSLSIQNDVLFNHDLDSNEIKNHFDLDTDMILMAAAEIKILTDTTEQIWVYLEKSLFTQAAFSYSRAQKVYTHLTGKLSLPAEKNIMLNSKINLLNHFPIINQQWAIISRLKFQITDKCTEFIKNGALEKNTDDVCSAICALLILNNNKIDQTCEKYLGYVFDEILSSMNSFTINNSSGKNSVLIYKYIKKLLCLIELSITQFTQLFMCRPYTKNSTDILTKPSLVIQNLLSFSINSTSNDKMPIENPPQNEKNLYHNGNIQNLGISVDSKRNENNDEKILGWVARRRSSLTQGQLIFTKKESHYDNSYQLSNFLPDFLKNYTPNLNHLSLPRYMKYSRDANDENPKKIVSPELSHELGYDFLVSGEDNTLMHNQLSKSILNSWIMHFQKLLKHSEILILSYLKTIEANPKDIISAIIMLTRAATIKNNFPEDSIPNVFFSNNNLYLKECNLLELELANHSSHLIESRNIKSSLRNVTFTLVVPSFDKYIYGKIKHSINHALTIKPKEQIESWLRPEHDLHEEVPSINNTVWNTSFGISNISNKNAPNSNENNAISAADNGIDYFSTVNETKKLIDFYLDPYPKPIEKIMTSIISSIEKSCSEIEEWRYILNTLSCNILNNNHRLKSLCSEVGILCVDLIEDLSNHLNSESRSIELSITNVESPSFNPPTAFISPTLSGGESNPIRSKSSEGISIASYLLGYLSESLITLLSNQSITKLISFTLDECSSNHVEYNENVPLKQFVLKDNDIASLKETLRKKISGISKSLISSSKSLLKNVVDSISKSFISRYQGSFSEILYFNERFESVAGNIELFNHKSDKTEKVENLTVKRDQLRNAANKYMSGLIKHGQNIISDREETKNLANKRKSSIREFNKAKISGFSSKNSLSYILDYSLISDGLSSTNLPSPLISEVTLDMFYCLQSMFFGCTLEETRLTDYLVSTLAASIEKNLSEYLVNLLEKKSRNINETNILQLFIDVSYLSLIVAKLGSSSFGDYSEVPNKSSTTAKEKIGRGYSGEAISPNHFVSGKLPFSNVFKSIADISSRQFSSLVHPFESILDQLLSNISKLKDNKSSDNDDDLSAQIDFDSINLVLPSASFEFNIGKLTESNSTFIKMFES
ncbi:hypothetical protein AYI70_g12184 [Smittium culicis]|uniref:Conserved oligomeric Golgi complex subunit 1 n=1 Tax=Smittium culicis TaxID=133412 RepID=A0A1R1WYI2_9FUNG|nr:hypothetical protein AYI70_g12184 [Smittium culicis]